MSDLLSEVDEAMRQDRAMEIWNKYGNIFIGALITLILATAVYSGYKHWSTSRAKENTGALLLALAEKEPVAPLLAYADENDGIYEAIARQNAGHYLTESGAPEKALEQFKRVESQESIDKTFTDYAALNAIYLKIKTEQVRDPDLEFLKTLMESKTSPWRFHARVAAAIITGDVNGDPAEAARILAPLTREGAQMPESLKRRAASLHHIYSILGTDSQ